MSRLSHNARLLLIVGIVITALSAIGVVVQGSAYSTLAADASYSAPQGGSSGMLGAALVAWNTSSQAQATTAMNMLIFMIIGLAIGILLIIAALRPPKPEPPPQPPKSYAEPFDENEPLLVSPERRRPPKKPLYWEEWDDSDSSDRPES